MTLRALRDRLSVVHSAIAALAVASGGGLRWWSLAVAAALTAWAFLRPLPPRPSIAAARLWTVGIVVALAATLTRALLRLEFLDAGVDFLLLLIVQRMFNRQQAREHAQILMLSSLLMVVAAVINAGLDFPLLFAAYLLAATMTLIVNHLISEGERLGRRVEAEVARAAIRSRSDLWRAAAGVTMIAAFGALVVFLVFPRWGAGVFLRGNLGRQTHSGFSGTVDLGGFGRIKSDSTVVARLQPLTPANMRVQPPWYLRGSALDRYERGRWTHGPDAERTPLQRAGNYVTFAPEGNRLLRPIERGLGRQRVLAPVPVEGFAASTEQLRVQVILEDIGVDVLFAASEPIGIQIRPRGAIERQVKLRGGLNREIRVEKPPGPIQYEFLSRIGRPTADELDAVGIPTRDPSLAPYLQRSETLSPEVTRLARAITAGATTRHDQVLAVMEHLSAFTYTTDLRESARVQEGADPVEGFLFDVRAGHCEYFATSMALLLREVGVPTRIVNGYYGGHFNDLGGFYAVRQADAHSWVEVHFGALGWITFDPTPPTGRTSEDGAAVFPRLDQALDALRHAYLEFVIDYDLTKQLSLLEGLGMRRTGGPFGSRVDWRGVGAWTGGIGLAVGLLVAWRRRRRRPPRSLPTTLYLRLVREFSARGHPRLEHESPTRYAARLHQRGVPGASAMRRFCSAYEDARFGRDPHASATVELVRLGAEVRTQIRQR
jgi:protein-glutamine gamma-glutamyltransferase